MPIENLHKGFVVSHLLHLSAVAVAIAALLAPAASMSHGTRATQPSIAKSGPQAPAKSTLEESSRDARLPTFFWLKYAEDQWLYYGDP